MASHAPAGLLSRTFLTSPWCVCVVSAMPLHPRTPGPWRRPVSPVHCADHCCTRLSCPWPANTHGSDTSGPCLLTHLPGAPLKNTRKGLGDGCLARALHPSAAACACRAPGPPRLKMPQIDSLHALAHVGCHACFTKTKSRFIYYDAMARLRWLSDKLS